MGGEEEGFAGVVGEWGEVREVVQRFGGRVGEEEWREVRERVGEFAETYPELEGMMERGFNGEDGKRMGFNQVRDILWDACEDSQRREDVQID